MEKQVVTRTGVPRVSSFRIISQLVFIALLGTATSTSRIMASMYSTELSPAPAAATVSQQKAATRAALGCGTRSGELPRTMEMTECWAALRILGFVWQLRKDDNLFNL